MSRRGAGGGIAAKLQHVAAGSGAWTEVGPFIPNRCGMQVVWTGTTNGAAVRVQGALTTASTAPVTLVLRRSSQGTAFVASTVATVCSYIRTNSTAGVYNGATKLATVYFAGYP